MCTGTPLEEIVESRYDRALLLSCFSKAFFTYYGHDMSVVLSAFISELRKHGADLVVAKCSKAPTGWRCTRRGGHSGPCAAIQE